MNGALQNAIAALADERRMVAARLDTIDLALENLRRLEPSASVPKKTVRVLAERRTTERRHVERRGVPTSENRALSQARMDAVLKALRMNGGVSTSKQLRAVMPKEPTLTEKQRAAAFSNTMTRLKGKGVVGRTGDTYSLKSE